MRRTARIALLGCLIVCSGCGGGSTAHWLTQLKAPEAKDRLQAIRVLQDRTGDAAIVVPALADALKDDVIDVRRTAAGALGTFGAEAAAAVPALTTALRDPEPAVRKTAGMSLKKIDPGAASKAGVK